MKAIYWEKFKEVIAFTSTVEMGNMAFQVGDNHDEVRKNRRSLYPLLKILNKERLVLVHQSHSDVCQEVTKDDLGKGAKSFESGVEADALYTKDPTIALGVFHADCVPVFFYVPNKGIVGIIHAGFKGTLKHITYKTVQMLIEKEGVLPDEIYFYLGPARQIKTFALNEDGIQNVIDNKCLDSLRIIDGKEHFDAVKSNTLDLIKLGVPLSHIDNSQIDTVEDERCFSAYKKEPLGRMVSVIKLAK